MLVGLTRGQAARIRQRYDEEHDGMDVKLLAAVMTEELGAEMTRVS